MTYPTIADYSTGNPSGTITVTSHVITLPTGIVAGDLILIFLTMHETGGSITTTWPAGWTEFIATYYGEVDGHGLAAYRVADGSEGSTITVTSSDSGASVFHAYRLTDTVGVPVGSGVHQGFAQGDPPSLTSGFGAVDTMWFAVQWYGNGSATTTAYPSGYSGGIYTISANANQCQIASCYMTNSAASEDPGTFTTSISPWMSAGTIAVQGAPTPSGLPSLFVVGLIG